MFKKRNAQGLSVTTIVVAVIALVIIIVLIAVFTGRIGKFSEGVNDASTPFEGDITCTSVCGSFGMTTDTSQSASQCGAQTGEREIPGSFSDVGPNKVCCCT